MFLTRLIERPPCWFRRLIPGGIFRLPSSSGGRKRICLTFDDGPIPEVTPRVLDILDRYGVKAIFFMVGDNAGKYPELVRKVLERGHTIGNHTFHHLSGAKSDSEVYMKDIALADDLLKSRLFRPPHGWLRPSQIRGLQGKYRLVMYDLVTRDYSRRLTPRDVVANVRNLVRDGSIIVFHDSLKSWPRLEKALPEAIEFLLSEGYEFVGITD